MERLAFILFAALTPLIAQTTAPVPVIPAAQQTGAASAVPSSDYLLGPGDQIMVFVADLPDEFADKTFRVDSAGDLSLPVIGHLHAKGLTTAELELQADAQLVHVLKNPKVSISIENYGSQGVAVLGAVNLPGIRQLEGHKTLFEMLAAAGGLRPDAGYNVNLTRSLSWGPIPLPEAKTDDAAQVSIVSIKLASLIKAANPADNIAVLPGDTISVPKADLVYAVGSVTKPGGFLLNEHETLSALQVVSLAEGLLKTASTSKAKILRLTPGSPDRIEIPVDLKKLMAGKGPDPHLQAEDILFVPNSGPKSAAYRSGEAAVTLLTGLVVYGRY